jgi:ubiquinol-cytochrome c reductase iron-sulfur subunit
VSPDCGGCAERQRTLATSEARQRRATVRMVAALVVAAAAAAGLVVVIVGGGNTQLEGLLAGLALAGPAFALVSFAHHRAVAAEVQVEERHAPLPGDEHGPGRPLATRRRLLVGVAALAGAVVVGTAATRDSPAERALRRTRWQEGSRLVTSEGNPIALGDLDVGGLQAVWPEGEVGAADSQALLIRLEPERMVVREGREDWAPEGHVVYSRLCTHMACPVSLYQQDPDVLLCPCHQATFAVLDGGRAIHGPASRPLPQLPLSVDDDGYLRAAGDFDGTVGAGFWSRPS